MSSRTAVPLHFRPRSGAAITLIAALAMAFALLAAPPARAATTDGGTLTPGTAVTAAFAAAGDAVTYTVAVPASQRLTLLVADSDAPVGVRVTATMPGDPRGGSTVPVTVLHPVLGNTAAAVRFTAFATFTADHRFTLTLTSDAPGALPFTPALVTDVPSQAIPLDAPTTVTITDPAQHALFSVPTAGNGVLIHVSGISLSPSTQPSYDGHPYQLVASDGSSLSIARVGPDAFLFRPYDSELYHPAWSLDVSAVGEATGTLVIEATANAEVAALAPGTSTTVTITEPGLTVSRQYPSTTGRRDRLDVTASTLTHPDGTPGRVTVRKGAINYQHVMGAIGGEPTVLEDPDPILASWSQQLDLVPDGESTGTITFTVALAPEPDPIALTLGTPGTVTLSTPHQNQFLTVPVTEGTTYQLAISDAAFTSPTNTSLVTLVHLQSPGASDWIRNRYANYSASLSQTQATATYTAPSSGDLTVLVNPVGDVTGHLTLTVTAT